MTLKKEKKKKEKGMGSVLFSVSSFSLITSLIAFFSQIPAVPLLRLVLYSSRIGCHFLLFSVDVHHSCCLKIQINSRVTICVNICQTWILFAVIWELSVNSFFIMVINMNRRKFKLHYFIFPEITDKNQNRVSSQF